jgi:ferric-dicitrate binding protein FerR (iron transport regulator)
MFDESRLDRLISAHFDGQLAAEEKQELEAMLLSSAKARQLFLDRAEWHALLREEALRRGGSELLESLTPAPRRPLPFSRRAGRLAALAACAALGVWLFPRGKTPDGGSVAAPPPRNDVALLDQVIDVEWVGARHAAGTALAKGTLEIRRGTLRLDFYSGARVTLEGPAEIELVSPDLARLHRGKLVAHVPPPAEGFTVMKGDLRVIDRGTEFGMSVDESDHCEVHVFDGEVELQGDVPASTARDLFEGEAVAIRNGKSTAISANRTSFIDPDRLRAAELRESALRREQWRATSEALRAAPGLSVYFDFEDFDPAAMALPNLARGAGPGTDGTVIGCERLTGHWPGKAALGFARTSDRVRFLPGGSTDSLTVMARVRVDSLPLDHNSLLSMSPEQLGEIHWKLDRSGRLLLGIRASSERIYESWERLASEPVVGPEDFGHWLHLATVIDGPQREMRHFVNGSLVARAPLTRPLPIPLGLANLGNFDPASPSATDSGITRSFNGRIDEFALFTRALSAEEITAMK